MNKLLIVFIVTSCLLINAQTTIDAEIENKNVERNIDLSSQLVKISYKITLGHKSNKNIASYTFAVPAAERQYLSFISGRDASKKEIKYTESKSDKGAAFIFTLTGNSPNPVIYIETVFSKALQPYPTHILQSDKQLVRYFGTLYFYSPYKTVSQKSVVQLASRSVESYTQVKPVSQSDSTLNYGPYENIARKFFKYLCLVLLNYFKIFVNVFQHTLMKNSLFIMKIIHHSLL